MGNAITTILWDNDGVLVDTEGLYYEATREVMAGFGIALSPQQYRQYCLHDNRGAWHLAQSRGHSRAEIDAAREHRNARYTELLRADPRLIDGVRETLESLHGRVRMGVVTSSMRCHFDVIHASTGLARYFDFVITAEDVRETKPHPELYEKGLIAAGSTPVETIVVEDSPRGLRAAVAAGIPCYVIPTPWTNDGEYSRAAGVLQSIREIPGLVSFNPTSVSS